MASYFHPVTPELLEDLKKVVGEKYVRYDEDTLEQYQTDEEGNPHFSRSQKSSFSLVLQRKLQPLSNLPISTLSPLRRGLQVPAWPVGPFLSTMAWWLNWSG